jgi:hypothetical protein
MNASVIPRSFIALTLWLDFRCKYSIFNRYAESNLAQRSNFKYFYSKNMKM